MSLFSALVSSLLLHVPVTSIAPLGKRPVDADIESVTRKIYLII